MCLAVPGKILSISGEGFSLKGRVSFGGVVREVSLAYVPEVITGQYVIVHAGFALSVLDEEEALKTLEYLEEVERLLEDERRELGDLPLVSDSVENP